VKRGVQKIEGERRCTSRVATYNLCGHGKREPDRPRPNARFGSFSRRREAVRKGSHHALALQAGSLCKQPERVFHHDAVAVLEGVGDQSRPVLRSGANDQTRGAFARNPLHEAATAV
jgi:hypothetical protein